MTARNNMIVTMDIRYRASLAMLAFATAATAQQVMTSDNELRAVSPPAYARAISAGIPAPKGFVACASGDRVASSVVGIAAKLGGELLGCFRAQEETPARETSVPAPMPVEYGFAIGLPGRPYTAADLDRLLTKVTEQWKDFEPLSNEFRENYTARLNDLIKRSDPGAGSTVAVSSVKPVLASIDRLDAGSYSVVSVRSYVFDLNGARVAEIKVNADAMVLRGPNLIRLTIQRTLSQPSDVERLQSEIAVWARTIERSSSSARDVSQSQSVR